MPEVPTRSDRTRARGRRDLTAAPVDAFGAQTTVEQALELEPDISGFAKQPCLCRGRSPARFVLLTATAVTPGDAPG